MNAIALIGVGIALGSAAAWAVGSILFRRIGDDASPLGMNLGKGLIGLVLLGGVLLAVGPEPLDTRTLFYLGTSGIVGIALGDTFFFMALMRLEPRMTLLLGTIGQVLTVLMALLFLGERPAPLAWAGIALVLGGVTWVMFEQLDDEDQDTVHKRTRGVFYGLAAAVCMSVGIILAKVGVESVSALEATFVRLAFGMAGLALYGMLTRNLLVWLTPFRSPVLLRKIFVAVLVVIFGGFWLSILALKYIDASLATILMSTEPLFILPLAVFILKEKVSLRAVVGAFVAVGGVVLIVLSFTS